MIEPMSRVRLAVHADHQEQLFAHLLANEIHLDTPLAASTSYSAYLAVLAPFHRGLPAKEMPLPQAVAMAEQLQAYIKTNDRHYQDTPETATHRANLGFVDRAGLSVDKLSQLQHLAWGVGYVPLVHHDPLKAQLGASWMLEHVAGGVCYFFYIHEGSQTEQVARLLSAHGFVSLVDVLINTAQVQADNQNTLLAELNISPYGIAEAYYALQSAANRERLARASDPRVSQFLVYQGYMSQRQAKALSAQMSTDSQARDRVWFEWEPVGMGSGSDPTANSEEGVSPIPTRLRNPRWAQPFEVLVRGHSVPAYNEFDPTPIVAILYPLFFGMMFGDVGQGLVIVILGLLFAQPVRHIVCSVGISSVLFGFVYGSVFGFEHVLPALWLQPSQHIETVIAVSVGLGVVMVTACMSLGMVQKWRQGRTREALTDTNGLIGLSFYVGMLLMILRGVQLMLLLMIVPFVVKLLLAMAKEPHNAMFTVIEAFESLISYASNTLSFIRVGAIVLSHSAMMGAVFMLTQDLGFFYGFIMVGVGNAVVMVVEIMVVAIQALRLNYYEVFSRFYAGSGRAFVSVREQLEQS